jgi:hypothetical protein
MEMFRPSSSPIRRDFLKATAAGDAFGLVGAVAGDPFRDKEAAVIDSVRLYPASTDYTHRLLGDLP